MFLDEQVPEDEAIAEEDLPEVHTSDRMLFKRCRRKWFFSSPMRMNLVTEDDAPAPFWFGSGMHFAMEDYHGYRRWPTPHDAFAAYCHSFPMLERPGEWKDLLDLGFKMLDYYVEHWLPQRNNQFHTVWQDGKPLVEINWKLRIPGVPALYGGTFDRVVRDNFNRWHIQDYKFMKKIDTNKLDIDQQISAYLTAADALFGTGKVDSILYTQFLKEVPDLPNYLQPHSDGRPRLSKAKSQKTTYSIYRRELLKLFGEVPQEYVEFLNNLGAAEVPEGNQYIRWDLVRRGQVARESQLQNIVLEARDMTDPNLPLYPNPTRDCNWDCPFRTPCIVMDEGGDWQSMIKYGYRERGDLGTQDWRSRIELPPPTVSDPATRQAP